MNANELFEPNSQPTVTISNNDVVILQDKTMIKMSKRQAKVLIRALQAVTQGA